MANQVYLEKWLNGTLNEEEKTQFEQTQEYRSLKRLMEATKSFQVPDYDEAGEFLQLQARMKSRGKSSVILRPWLNPLLRIAAVLILMTGGYFIFQLNSETTVKTLSAEKTKLYLPDSSEVTLNSISVITYHQNRWPDQRLVSLDGEAFFKVARGSRFDVETKAGTISVLGTQFNVKTRQDFFEVVCYEGRVKVSSAGKVLELSPNNMFRVVKGVVFAHQDPSEPIPSWLNNESSFESVPFGEVLKEFERQYNVTFSAKNVNLDKLFTGRFGHSDFHKSLQSITIPLNLSYKVSADQKIVVLSGEAN